MDAYVLDGLGFLLRWAHVITGIAWIGASFYFVGLDSSLTPPADDADRAKGIGGELWAVHGGGFYHQQKYPVAPSRLPEHLHWSMWESYSTWLTVFALWLSCHLFAGRAAFLLVGAMMATTMTANVAMVIIPGQRKVVAALREGCPVDPIHGRRGKQRSVHNTY